MAGERIGMTSTIPVEVIYAADLTPVDLNNVFITHESPSFFIEKSEDEGFPRNVCAWIKAIFAVVAGDPSIQSVIAVTQGDCSNTHALMEVLNLYGRETIPFDFPLERTPTSLKAQIERLVRHFGTTWEKVGASKQRLDGIRRKLIRLDEMTWRENLVRGGENHLWLVSSSDFGSDPDSFEWRLDAFLEEARQRPPQETPVRLGYVGVPPIFADLYECVESFSARVVYNEIQRQFAMPYLCGDIVEQYLQYTYPYDIFSRIRDIKDAVRERNIRGLIHYTQSFCHRQIQDLILRRMIDLPILTLEGDSPGPLDNRTRIRLEAFIDMLS